MLQLSLLYSTVVTVATFIVTFATADATVVTAGVTTVILYDATNDATDGVTVAVFTLLLLLLLPLLLLLLRGVAVQWLARTVITRPARVRFPDQAASIIRFKNLALYIRDCVSLCLSDESLKSVGPFYLVSMPGEVKYPTSLHWKGVTCLGLHILA